MPRFNRVINILFSKVLEGGRREPVTNLRSAAHIGSETKKHLPLSISANFHTSIQSTTDSGSFTVHNPIELETLYEQNAFFFEDFSKNHYEADIQIGDTETLEIRTVFTGDVIGISVPKTNSNRDQPLQFEVQSGSEARARGFVNHRMQTGETYRDLVKHIFDEVYQPQFGIRLQDKNIVDPENILLNEFRRPFTAHRPASAVLEDLGRGVRQDLNRRHFGFTWNVGPYLGSGFREAFFVDKRAIFDLDDEPGPKELSHETGRVGRIGYGKASFEFSHLPDVSLRVGNHVVTRDKGTMLSGGTFEGRIDSISASLSNKNGGWIYEVKCSWIKDGLAVLDSDRRIVSSRNL